MSATLAITKAPDLGAARAIEDARVPNETLVNLAGVLEIARRAGTPKAKLFHDAFSLAYERVAALPMTDGAKQQAALSEALKVCGFESMNFVTLEGR